MKKSVRETHDVCVGFVQETENGGIYELGNGWMHRRIIRLGKTVTTGSLTNVVNGEEYLDESVREFAIELIGDYEELTLSASDFEIQTVSTPIWIDKIKELRFDLSADVLGETLEVSLFYQSEAGNNLTRKWLQIGELIGWQIGRVTLEELQIVSDVEAVQPACETDSDTAAGRFIFRETSDSLLELWGCSEGIFALATEGDCTISCNSEGLLCIEQTLYASTETTHTTAQALIGAYRGRTEFGFHAYRTAKSRECRPKNLQITTPKSALDTDSMVELRAQIYCTAWKTPLNWLDTSALKNWISGASQLTKQEHLHLLLSTLGLLKAEEVMLLGECIPDVEAADAAKRAVEFLERFQKYFGDYRHLFGLPDGESAEGHAHFIAEAGFIVLINPADETVEVDIPLEEPGLWLSADKNHKLSDWSTLKVGVPMDDSKVSPTPKIDLAPREVRIIGVNISE